jgi:DNA-binding NtrC family response regulator
VENHNWPGNIRELKSVLKRAGILGGDTITGRDIQEIINQSSFTGPQDKTDDKPVKIREEIKSGKNFWEAVKKPFLERTINRDQAREIIRGGLMDAGGKYVDLLPLFNLAPADYHRFMAFLSDYRLK